MAYTIGSNKGKEIANSMKAGETYKASDGSTWTKNSDGSVSVRESNGNVTANAYSGSSSSSSKSSSSGSGSYKPLGTYNDADLSAADAAKVQQYKSQYEAAKAAGNTKGMEEAHAAAEAIRKNYNYYGGVDGSDYIGIGEEIFPLPSFNYDTQSRPSYSSNYNDDIDNLLNQILTRDDFSYDVEKDPLYAQYKQQYLREGNRAMNDVLAETASNAGGMNSYAVTAAQQANNYYASQLGDKIPELYQLAYSMYLDDIDNEVRNLGLLQNMDNTQYGRYRDTMSDWENDRDFAYGKYRDDMGDYFNNRDFEYGVSRDEISDDRYDQEWEYNTGVNDKNNAYNQAIDWMNIGIMPSNDILTLAGISTEEAQAYLRAKGFYVAAAGGNSAAAVSSGSSGTKKSGGTKVTKTQRDVKNNNTPSETKPSSNYITAAKKAVELSNANGKNLVEGKRAIVKYLDECVKKGSLTKEEALNIASIHKVPL